MSASNIISLLGGVALFLFGMALMGEGLKKVAGNSLELILYKLSSNPFKGILLGTGVTAVIQSSSATSVMVVGFVNSGMMQLRQAISIILGSILGTSITGWVLCLSDIGGDAAGWVSLLSTSTLTALMAIIGILMRMISKKRAVVYSGNILLGFSVLLFGMSSMSGAVAPLRESEAFLSLMTRFSNPVLGILIGAAFTAVLQSASAAVGIVQALSITGTIRFELAFPLILGIAVGAAVPVLLSAIDANVRARQSAFAYLLIAGMGMVIVGAVFYILNAVVHFGFMDMAMTTVSIAALNTVVRLFTVLALAPLLGVLERICTCVIPDNGTGAEDTPGIERLEERFLQNPALAIAQSGEAVQSMALKAQDNLVSAFELLHHYSDKGYSLVQDMESAVDRYEDKLGTYLIKITACELDRRQSDEVSKFLHTIGDFERMSDHATNVADAAREIAEKDIVFSSEAAHELEVLTAAVGEIASLAVSAFVENDLELAARVEPLEELIDELCDEGKLHHIARLQKNECTLINGFVFNDLLTNLERVADHCSNIAVAIIELESDSFDTHEYLRSLKAMHSGSFDRYAEEYEKKFRF